MRQQRVWGKIVREAFFRNGVSIRPINVLSSIFDTREVTPVRFRTRHSIPEQPPLISSRCYLSVISTFRIRRIWLEACSLIVQIGELFFHSANSDSPGSEEKSKTYENLRWAIAAVALLSSWMPASASGVGRSGRVAACGVGAVEAERRALSTRPPRHGPCSRSAAADYPPRRCRCPRAQPRC
jgi:hypothetical protein